MPFRRSPKLSYSPTEGAEDTKLERERVDGRGSGPREPARDHRLESLRKRMGSGGPRGLQIRRRRGLAGTGRFDSDTLPPLPLIGDSKGQFGHEGDSGRGGGAAARRGDRPVEDLPPRGGESAGRAGRHAR